MAVRNEKLSSTIATPRTLGHYIGGLGIPVARVLLTGSGLRMSEAGIRALTRAGLAPDEAARAWRVLFTYAIATPARAAADDGEAATAVRVALAGLPPDEYPALAGAAEAFAAAGDDEVEFRYGLERLLDGVEARRGPHE